MDISSTKYFDARELVEWTKGNWLTAPPESIAGISKDSRTMADGCLYLALQGENYDGHVFVDDARKNGAAGAIISRESLPAVQARLASEPRFPLLAVEDTHLALRDMAASYRAIVDCPIVGITGSVGKTTVKEMASQMMASEMATASTHGNYNNKIGLPISLLDMARDTEVGVFEIGTNHPGEIAELASVLQPTWGIVTSVGPVHLEYFDSVESIAREKADLLAALPSDGVAVLDCDGDFYDILKSFVSGSVVTVSLNGEGDYSCRAGTCGRVTIRETSTNDECSLSIPLPGEHNIVNAMLAVAAARGNGISWEGIQSALDSFDAPGMRWEVIHVAGLRVVNDAYNANPMSMRAAIRTLADIGSASRWLVLGVMLELGNRAQEEHRKIGEFVAEAMTTGPAAWGGLIVVGEYGCIIARAARDAGLSAKLIIECESTEDASDAIAEVVPAGDTVLLKASRAAHFERIVTILERRSNE